MLCAWGGQVKEAAAAALARTHVDAQAVQRPTDEPAPEGFAPQPGLPFCPGSDMMQHEAAGHIHPHAVIIMAISRLQHLL